MKAEDENDRLIAGTFPRDAFAGTKPYRPPLPSGSSTPPATATMEVLPGTFTLSDTGNAERLVALHREAIRYCEGRKAWFLWDGRAWRKDETRKIETLAKDTVVGLGNEAKRAANEGIARATLAHASKSHSRRSREAMVALARSEPSIAIASGQMDRDPWLLNVANGTLDLRTGELREHRREDYITRCLAIPYEPQASAPTWDSFLRRVDLTRFRGHPSRLEGVAGGAHGKEAPDVHRGVQDGGGSDRARER